MAEFAPVAPLEIHKRLEEADVLGRYHLLLAHEVNAAPQAYAEFWRQLEPAPFIIMDNSLIELGKALPMEAVVEAAYTVGAGVVVLPDVLGDRIKTLEESAKAFEDFQQLPGPKPLLLAVAQGQTFNDVFSCGRDLIKELGVGFISVPRHVTGKVGSRVRITQYLSGYGVKLHLLGFSKKLHDDVRATSNPYVWGIDSAMPIWLGIRGYKLPENPARVNGNWKAWPRPKPYGTWTWISEEVIHNVRRVRQWLTTAQDVLIEPLAEP